MGDFAISAARQLSIGLMAMAAAGIGAIFFESRPIRLAFPNQFFLCVVTRRFGGGDRRRYMDS
ncbi:hypothetical protein [Mesorhizobium huakuii]|uniref:Uncharacterized protein n=1 Tax=Mesorhizobium huakuii TaxID=28104 RepID=A0A7G6SSD3_9HYPH|nr:hypothetical protein [Mesorhizobium huakuii]QND57415.1 hypothetical protein HB778_12895 [Mesorhizobium huakuii]